MVYTSNNIAEALYQKRINESKDEIEMAEKLKDISLNLQRGANTQKDSDDTDRIERKVYPRKVIEAVASNRRRYSIDKSKNPNFIIHNPEKPVDYVCNAKSAEDAASKMRKHQRSGKCDQFDFKTPEPLNEEVQDKWFEVDKEDYTDKQIKYFFACGAARNSKEGDGKIEINFSKIPKEKSNEGNSKEDGVYPKKGHWVVIFHGEEWMEVDSRKEGEEELSELREKHKVREYEVHYTIVDKQDHGMDNILVVKAETEKQAEDIALKKIPRNAVNIYSKLKK